MRNYKNLLITFVCGTVLATALVALLMLTRPEQCPDGYTESQVDASNCIIGADIGTGLGFLFIILVWVIVTLSLATTVVLKTRKK